MVSKLKHQPWKNSRCKAINKGLQRLK